MKNIIVSSIISLTLLNSGLSFNPTQIKVTGDNNSELKQIINVSDYSSKPHDLGISKLALNLEKIKVEETKKIEDQQRLQEEARLKEEQRLRQLEEEQKRLAEIENQKILVVKQAYVPPVVASATIVPVGEIQTYAKNRVCEVFGCDQWDAYYFIINKETHWNYLAINPSSGAGGLCQSLPFSKMASAGADYRTNPNTQTEWCLTYIAGRYKNPIGAKAFWVNNNWF
jgi:hypothetical protein